MIFGGSELSTGVLFSLKGDYFQHCIDTGVLFSLKGDYCQHCIDTVVQGDIFQGIV